MSDMRTEFGRRARKTAQPREPVGSAPLVTRWRVAALALLVAIGGLVAADRVTAHMVTNRIASRAGCVLGADHTTAALTSSTVLPQLISGDLGTVDVDASGVHRRGTSVSVSARLNGVTTDGHVSSGSETVTAPYRGVLNRMLGGGSAASGAFGGRGAGPSPVSSISGDGRFLQVGMQLPQAGVPLTMDASVRVSGETLTVTPVDLEVMGHVLPVDRIRPMLAMRNPAMAQKLAPHQVSLPNLPAGVEITRVTPQPDGLHIDARSGPMSPADRAGVSHCF